MKVAVIGTGYVGLVTGACLASVGHEVVCVDANPAKIAALQAGQLPIYEPGLEPLVKTAVDHGLLSFVTSLAAALATPRDGIFIAVGTPPGEDGSADLRHVLAVARDIGEHLAFPAVVIDKSTVPVGTAEQVEQVIRQHQSRPVPFHVVSNPEFLKEGAAIDDFLRPARVIVGTDSEEAAHVLRQLYAPFTRNHARFVLMGRREAEMTKYAANAMLATRISFMNELAVLCDQLGVDIEQVRAGVGSDPRIGTHFLYAGVGYGGSCFPKDVQALIHTADRAQVDLGILQAVERRNHLQKRYLVDKAKAHFQGELAGRRVALWGLAFKAGTDDMREAPALDIIADLLAAGAEVRVYDPVARETARIALAERGIALDPVCFSTSADQAVEGADALMVVTDWPEFRVPDFAALARQLQEAVVFDGRNLYDPAEVRRHGLFYYGVGR